MSLHDHVIRKPPGVGAYETHRMLEGLTGGGRPQFVDMGDRLIVRGPQELTPDGRPLPDVKAGEIRAFELRASCGVKAGSRHMYFELKDWRSRHGWLERRSARSGFEVLTVNVTARRVKIDKGGRGFMMDRSDFTGILRVTDPEAFTRTLAVGIGGPGKAFGHGMLVV